MPTLSGILRFWSNDDAPTELRLDRVAFVFEDTWEPSLIVEDFYVAVVEGRRVRFGEFDGISRGLSIKVEGAEHAELVDWVRHVPGSEDTVPGEGFVDTLVIAMAKGWGG